MKVLKITLFLSVVLFLTSCASGYRTIDPAGLSYNSTNKQKDISMEYKYDLLRKKYARKEQKKDVRLVAVKITNNTGRDLVFNRDLKLTYDNGGELVLLEREKVFSNLRQHPATYLFYLLLSPLSVSATKTDSRGYQTTSSSFPAGLIVGPGLAGGNVFAAASANKKFKEELLAYDILGKTISRGETVFGLVGVRADNYDALKITLIDPELKTGSEDIAR